MDANLIQNIKVKKDTFSGTTDGTGNLLLSNNRRCVLGVEFNALSLTGYGFIYATDATYLRVLSNSNTLQPNTAVSGTYWYIDV